MDFYRLPFGFGMALTRDFNALNAYSAMTEAGKQAVVDRARNARSEQEMNQIVRDMVENRM